MALIFKLVKRGFRLVTDRQYKPNAVIHNRYKVKSMLGLGSYGMTYLCKDLEANRICVLKQMTKSKNNKFILDQYKQELAILGHINHSRIPTLFESFSFENNYFFSMEYMEGRNLEDVIFYNEHQFKEKDALLLLKEILQIVDYLHSLGIVHRDIRIPNVILHDYKPSIIDFGLADFLEKVSASNDYETRNNLLREDFYDLGDLLLFLLYSNYHSEIKKGRPWTEELTLHPKTSYLLKRLLQIEQPYTRTREILDDVNKAINYLN